MGALSGRISDWKDPGQAAVTLVSTALQGGTHPRVTLPVPASKLTVEPVFTLATSHRAHPCHWLQGIPL